MFIFCKIDEIVLVGKTPVLTLAKIFENLPTLDMFCKHCLLFYHKQGTNKVTVTTLCLFLIIINYSLHLTGLFSKQKIFCHWQTGHTPVYDCFSILFKSKTSMECFKLKLALWLVVQSNSATLLKRQHQLEIMVIPFRSASVLINARWRIRGSIFWYDNDFTLEI